VRATFIEGLESLLETLVTLVDGSDDEQKRQQALMQYSLMVGALTLARATRGDPLSDEILQAATSFLTTS